MTDDTKSRRSFLKTVGAAGATLAVGATAVGSAAAASLPDGVDSIEARGSCDRVHWVYDENVDRSIGWGGYTTDYSYDKRSPINVVAEGFDVTDIASYAESASDWQSSRGYWPRFCEYDYYVWNADEEYMQGPDRQPHDGYVAVGTAAGCNGTGERDHARCYEIEPGVVAIQAHHDPHEHGSGTTYNDGASAVIDLIEDEGGSDVESVETDAISLYNEKKDYNGEADLVTGTVDEVDVNC